MKLTKFENAEVGNRVWSSKHGWGKIIKVDKNKVFNLLVASFLLPDNTSIEITYTFDGRESLLDLHPTLFWNEVKLPTEKEDKKPFDLVEFLRENFTKVDFTPWNDNLFIYYDYNRKELLIKEESIDDNIGTVYLKFNDIVTPSRINSVISKLNESKVVPHQLKQAYKELGWL